MRMTHMCKDTAGSRTANNSSMITTNHIVNRFSIALASAIMLYYVAAICYIDSFRHPIYHIILSLIAVFAIVGSLIDRKRIILFYASIGLSAVNILWEAVAMIRGTNSPWDTIACIRYTSDIVYIFLRLSPLAVLIIVSSVICGAIKLVDANRVIIIIFVIGLVVSSIYSFIYPKSGPLELFATIETVCYLAIFPVALSAINICRKWNIVESTITIVLSIFILIYGIVYFNIARRGHFAPIICDGISLLSGYNPGKYNCL